MDNLHNHLLGRMLRREFDSDDHDDFSDTDRNCIHILQQKIYSVKRLQVNYTTYDVRRDYDSMNPSSQCDVMVRAPDSVSGGHPFWYARILGVFHADVLCVPKQGCSPSIKPVATRRMEFLWVRWFGNEQGWKSGSKAAALPKIGFVPSEDRAAFGFLDPSLVIRACHLIPNFDEGKTDQLLTGASMARKAEGEKQTDWVNYYVGV